MLLRTLTAIIGLVVLVGCSNEPDDTTGVDAAADAGNDASGDTSIPADCGSPLCIAPADAEVIGEYLIDEGPNSACIAVTGFNYTVPARLMLDGEEILVERADSLGCLGGTLPEHTPGGEVWVVQGIDADGDGVEDPGTAVESNRLQLVTQPWITGASATEVEVGEELTLTAENLPPDDVPLSGASTRFCQFEMGEPVGNEVTVAVLGDSLGVECGFGLVAGNRGVTNPRNVEDPDVSVTLLPSLDGTCATRPGLPCAVYGRGFGADIAGFEPGARSIEVDGVVVPHDASEWTPVSVTFNPPEDLEPGSYPFKLVREDGREVSGELTILGWGRAPVDSRALGFPTDHEGFMADVPVAFIDEGAGGAIDYRREFFVGHGFGFQGWGPPNPDATTAQHPFLGSSIGSLQPEALPWNFDYPCDRSRFTIIPPVGSFLDDPHIFVMAGARQGHCAWDQAPAFPIEIGVYQSPGTPLFEQNAELLQYEEGRRVALGGIARFVFDSQPPRPDPDGRPGRLVPIVAINDLDAETTQLLRVYDGAVTPQVEEPFAGVGTLHEAGETIYLAGGDDGFTGSIYEITWTENRQVPLPIEGLDAARMPHFAGDADGSLWVTVVTEAGAVEIHRWDPAAAEWALEYEVPSDVPGADRPGLGGSPEGLGWFDMAAFDGVPVVAVPVREGASVDVSLYAPNADGTWSAVYEEIALWEWDGRPCGSYVAIDDPRSTPECPPNRRDIAAASWRRMEGQVRTVQLWSAADAVWVRYDRTDEVDASGHADWVARPLAGRFGQ